MGPIHQGPNRVRLAPEELARWLAGARGTLKHDPVILSDEDHATVASAIEDVCRRREVAPLALAIMPEHVHVVIRWPPVISYERAVNAFKGVASRDLRARWGWPAEVPPRPAWARKYWVRYLNDDTAIQEAVHYVRLNPVKDGMPPQDWPFVGPGRSSEHGG
jgi:REP element-mobilizing transposase RayT